MRNRAVYTYTNKSWRASGVVRSPPKKRQSKLKPSCCFAVCPSSFAKAVNRRPPAQSHEDPTPAWPFLPTSAAVIAIITTTTLFAVIVTSASLRCTNPPPSRRNQAFTPSQSAIAPHAFCRQPSIASHPSPAHLISPSSPPPSLPPSPSSFPPLGRSLHGPRPVAIAASPRSKRRWPVVRVQ